MESGSLYSLVCLFSLKLMILRFLYLVACSTGSCLLLTELYFVVWMHHFLFIHFSGGWVVSSWWLLFFFFFSIFSCFHSPASTPRTQRYMLKPLPSLKNILWPQQFVCPVSKQWWAEFFWSTLRFSRHKPGRQIQVVCHSPGTSQPLQTWFIQSGCFSGLAHCLYKWLP